MANLPISGLPAGSALAGTEPFPAVQSATTVKVTATQIKTFTSNAPTFTGVAAFDAGAAALPSIIPTGDTNTGFWFPAADTIAASTGGTERVRITSGGDVLIGTATGGARLCVSGGSLPNISGSQAFGLSSLLTTGWCGVFDANSLNSISTGADAASMEMSVGQTAGFQTGISITGKGATNFQGAIRFRTGSTERMRIDSAGNVGIGTTAPQALLDVYSTGNTTLRISGSSGGGSSVSQIDFFRIGSNVLSSIVAIRDGGNTSGALTFYTAAAGATAERMRIDSAGNVGIGVTPSAWSSVTALEVGGTGGNYIAGLYDILYLGANNYYNGTNYIYKTSSFASQYQQTAGTHRWFTAASGTAGNAVTFSERMRIDASGNVGIGTSAPSNALDVTGDIRSTSFVKTDYVGNKSYSSGQGYLQFTTTDTIFKFNVTEQMRLTSSGNIGIGTASPTALLDVNSNTIRVRTAKTPASATDTGNAGDICWDSGYVYVCTATNTWKRAALATW